MKNHTPGPWHVELGGFVYSETKKVADVGLNGGYFASKISPEPERTANARLIAAAPELLEALEDAATQLQCDCGHPHCGRCKDYKHYAEVIAKARRTP